MRKTILLLITLVCMVGYANAQWKWQNPLPQGNDLWSVNFPNANTGYAVGLYGTILKTTTAGEEWHVISDNAAEHLYSICFTDVLHGVAVGLNGTILKTTDGGTNWVTIPNVLNQTLYKVEFPTADTGYAVGSAGTILKTTDAGQTWVQQQSNNSTATLSSMFFFNDDIGYVGGGDGVGGDQGILFKTIDGGQTWVQDTILSPYYGNFSAIYFTDFNTGYIGYGLDAGFIYKTIDGGLTWTSQYTNCGWVNEFCFTDSNNGYFVSSGGSVAKTTDGGTSWVITYGFNGNAHSIAIASGSTAYVVGFYGNISKTSDAGQNWVKYNTSVTSNNCNSVAFANNSTGVSVGPFGTIIRTDNSGINWDTIHSPVYNATFNTAAFKDQNTGFIGGNSGVLLKTTNAGADWSTISSGTTKHLSAMHFPSSQVGYITMSSVPPQNILKTIDGGDNWTILSNTAIRGQYSVYFTSVDTGFVCGNINASQSAISKTTDGGVTWVKTLTTSGSPFLYTIVFPQKDTGYCAGGSGVMFKTTNAGLNWSQLSQSYIVGSIKSLFFFDANHGYAISGNKLIKTIDGGQTWVLETIQQTLAGQPRIYFLNDSTGWVFGTSGAILHRGEFQTAPTAFAVTGGGSYCQGGSGLPVGLVNSEIGVTYTIYKDAIAQAPTVAGTGSAITFGNQFFGTYTVSGTSGGGTTPMTGSAVITETAAVAVSVTIASDINPVPEGSSVTLTATPVNGGSTPSYQWKVNGTNAGTDSIGFTYTPANTDTITCTLTSSETCTTGNPATSNEVIITVIPGIISLQNIVVADGDTNCYDAIQTIYIAGGETTFTIQSGGSATMIAGESIVYQPGATVDSGGYMHGYISTEFCTNPANPVVNNPVQPDRVQNYANEIIYVNRVMVYPNPTTGTFTVEIKDEPESGRARVEIFSMRGDKVLHSEISENGKIELSLSGKPVGIYVIRVICGSKTETARIIRQ